MSLDRMAWALWLLIFLAHVLHAQEKPLKDANGDPLPLGVIGRIGQLSFRVAAPVDAAMFLDGGSKLLVRTRGAGIRDTGPFQLFDARNGKELNRIDSRRVDRELLKGEEKGSRPPAFLYDREWRLSPNGKWLARVDPVAAKNTTKFELLEVATGKTVAAIEETKCSFHHPQFSPDSKHIAMIVGKESAGPDSDDDPPALIRMWDIATQREVKTFALPPQSKEPFQPRVFAFSPDGAYLAVSGKGSGLDSKGVVRVWQVAGDKPSWALEGQHLSVPNGWLEVPTAFSFSPDSKNVAALHDGKLGLWDAATGKLVKELGDYQRRCAILAFSPTGKHLIACRPFDYNGRAPTEIQMWDIGDGKQFGFPVDHPRGFVFSEKGDTLVIGDEAKILICDGGTGQVKHTIDIEKRHAYRLEKGLAWPIALSPDGKTLVFADRAGQIQRISVATGKPLAAPEIATEVAEALAFSPDGKKLLAAGKTQVLLHQVDGSKAPMALRLSSIEDAKNRDSNETPRVHVGNRVWPNARCVAMSSDGSHAAAGLVNGFVCVWNISSGKLLWQSRAGDAPIHCVAFAADDKSVISSGLNGQIVWWDAATGRSRRTLERVPGKFFKNHESLPYRLSYSGLTAFGESPNSHGLEEWELASGKVRRTLDVQPSPIDVTRDGRSMLVVGENAYHSIDLVSGKPLRSFSWAHYPQPETNPHGWCRFSPDGALVAGLVHKDTLAFWDAATATPLASVTDRAGFKTLAFAPDGKTVATAGGDGIILLWRTPPSILRDKSPATSSTPKTDAVAAKEADGSALPSGARARLGSLRFQQGDDVYALRYSPDGESIIAATVSNTSHSEWDFGLAVWASETGRLLARSHALHDSIAHYFDRGPPPENWRLSPDGKLLATMGLPGRKDGGWALTPLVVRELTNGKILAEIEGGSRARFSPDGKTLAILGGTVKLYDLSTGKERATVAIDVRDYNVLYGHFTADGKFVVIVAADSGAREIRWWRHGEVNAVNTLPHRIHADHKGRFRELSSDVVGLSPDSRQLAFVSEVEQGKPPHLILVEIESGKITRDFGEQSAAPERLVFSPDGKQLASLSAGKLDRFDVNTGKRLPQVDGEKFNAIQFAPHGNTVAIADGKTIRICNATSGVERFRVSCRESRHSRGEHGEGDPFAFSPDGKKLASADGRVIRQWNVATGREIGPTPFSETIHALAASKGANRVAACTSRQVLLWDASGQVVLRIAAWQDSDKRQVALTALALSADGQCLAVGGSDGDIALYDVRSGNRRHQLPFHKAPVTSLVFAVDGSELTSADNKSQAARWNVASGQRIQKYSVPQSEITGKRQQQINGPQEWHGLFESSFFWSHRGSAALSPDGERLVTPSQKALDIWSLNQPSLPKARIARPHQGNVAVSGDGRFLIAGPNWDESYYRDRDSALDMIDLASGKTERIFANFPRIRDFSISPDGKLLAACGTDGLCLWDTATGTHQAHFNGHRGTVTTVAFSPDGVTLLSAAMDGTVLVWDVARLIAAPPAPPLADSDLDAIWTDLGAADAQAAGAAMKRLIGQPRQSVGFLGQRLKPVAVSKEMLTRLVADLDDNRFEVRDTATKKLKELAELGEPALRACLAAKPSPEQQERIEKILAKLSEPISDSNKLRALRCAEVLIAIGSSEAIELLQKLATGTDCAYETREARAALRWMKR